MKDEKMEREKLTCRSSANFVSAGQKQLLPRILTRAFVPGEMSGGAIWEGYESVSLPEDIWFRVSSDTHTSRQSVVKCGVACHNTRHSCNTFLYDQQYRQCYHGFVVRVMSIEYYYDELYRSLVYLYINLWGRLWKCRCLLESGKKV